MDQKPDFPANGKLLAALSLAPFVAVAWAEAGLDDVERALVLSWAAELGLTKADSGYVLLEHWLRAPPSPRLLAVWKSHYVDALSRSLSSEAREEFKRHVMRRMRALVQTTGGFSSVRRTPSASEQLVIHDIESAFS